MDQPGPAAPSSTRLLGGWLRWVVAGLLVGVVVLAAAGAGLWLFRAPAATWLIARAAESAGLGPARLTIDRLDLSGLVIRDLRLGDGDLVTVAEMTASYTLEQLRRRSIDTLKLRGVRLQAVVDSQAIRIGGFVRPLGQGRGQRRGLPALPLHSLELERLEAVVETPLGPVAAAGTGGVQARPDGGIGLTWDGRIDGGGGAAAVRATGDVRGGAGRAIAGDVALSIAGGRGAFTGALTGQVTGSRSADGAVSLQATVGDGELQYSDGRVDGISGTAAYVMAADGTRIVRTALSFQGVDAFGQALEPGRVSLELDGDLLRADADLVAPGVRATVAAVGSVRDLNQPVALSATGTADVARLLVLLPLPGAVSAAGELDFALAGRVTEPLQVAQAKDRLVAALVPRLALDGTLGVQLRAAAVPGWLTDGEVAGRIAISAGGGAVDIAAPDAVRLSGALDPGRLVGLPEPLRALLGGVLQVQVGGADTTPLGLRIEQAEDGVAVAATTGVRLAAGETTVTAELDARGGFDGALRPIRIDVPFLLATAENVAIGGASGRAELFVSDLKGTPSDVAGQLAMSAAGAVAGQALAVGAAAIDLDAALSLRQGRLTLEPASGSRLRLSGLALASGTRTAAPLTIGFGGDGNVIRADVASRAVEYRLALAPTGAELVLAGAGGSVRLDLPTAVVSGVLGGAQEIEVRDARLDASRPRVAVEGLSGTMTWNAGAVRASLQIARVAHQSDTPWMQPAAAAVELDWADGAVGFGLSAALAVGGLTATLRGRHDVAASAGVVEIDVPTVRFAADGLQPVDLFPLAGQALERVQGAIAVAGRVSWSGGTVASALDIALNAVGFAAGATEISALTGAITLDGLTPPTTPPDQHLTVSVAVGSVAPMPVDLSLQLRPDGTVYVSTLTVAFADGFLRANDITFDPATRTADLALTIDGVDMAQVAALVSLPGLEAEGRLDGILPLRLTEGAAAVVGGALASRGPGVLRYSGQGLPERLAAREDTVGLAMQALSDFRYERLEISVDKALAGAGSAILYLEGANPAVLEGYPFVFNIDLSADFNRLVALILEGLGQSQALARFAVEQAR